MIEIVEVKSRGELRQFIQFPHFLYRDDPCYIQEPFVLQRARFDRKKNPFFLHSKADYFLAFKEHHISGRIALIRNNNHIAHTGEQSGFFGFFESINDFEVAEALLQKAVTWNRQEGLTLLRGPENFTTNESCGMLISGFDTPPVVMMPYNKSWYNDFLVRFGFEKEIDLLSYALNDDLVLSSPSMDEILKRISGHLAASDITIQPISYKMLDQEIIPLLETYNQANKDNWGFLPMTVKEFSNAARQFRQFVPEELILIVKKKKKPIGFIMALPDLNQVFRHIKSGKSGPFGILKLLWHKRKINNARILILGMLDEYRNKGFDLILYRKIKENCMALGMNHGEACYVMENNRRMRSIIEKIGGKCIKHYRIYKFAGNSIQ